MQDLLPDMTWLTRPDGMRLAIRHDPGRHDPGRRGSDEGPGILFLHGMMSDMQGDKAQAVARHARASGWECLRLDMSGHGKSEGRFEDGTVSRWRDDALLALGQLHSHQAIIVGSSIGGWIALLAALARPGRIAGLLLIAPAPDMTRRVGAALSDTARAALREHGVWHRPSQYGAPIPISQAMLDDGDRHCLLDGPIALSCPIRILHGQQDADVPWQDSLRLAECLQSADVRTILVKQADHRLSQPQDLTLLTATLDEVRAQSASSARIAASPSR